MKLDLFIEKIIRGFFGVFKINLKDSLVKSLVQFVKFGMVGVTNTVLAYLINVGVLFAFKPLHFRWDYLVGNIVSFILSVLWSFYWNNKYVFVKGEGEKRSIWLSLIKTYISYGFTGIILCNILSYVWIDVLGINKYVAPLINLVVSVPLNFIINKFWAFSTKKVKKESVAEKENETENKKEDEEKSDVN